MEFWTEYGLFLAKSATVLVVFLLIVGSVAAASGRQRRPEKGHITVTHLNERFDHMYQTLRDEVLNDDDLKRFDKEQKEREKKEQQEHKKQRKEAKDLPLQDIPRKKRVYVIDFAGDVAASAVAALREEVSTVLSLATNDDEVVIRLESPGGMVHAYGLASSQLDRVVQKNIPLTVCVDKVAASGGYMMACIADHIVAAPFAIVGSIGVLAEVPNLNRLLKKHDIDYEVLTAGEYKAPMTMLGENTEKGRKKFLEDLEETHLLFKEHVKKHRHQLEISKVATGEIWYGQQAVEEKLVDEIATSDDYLTRQLDAAEVFEIAYELKRSLPEKLGIAAQHAFERASENIVHRLQKPSHQS